MNIIAFSSAVAQPTSHLFKGFLAANDSVEVPFYFTWQRSLDGSTDQITIHNAEERIKALQVQRYGDTLLRWTMPVFNSTIEANIEQKEEGFMPLVRMQGTFRDPLRSADYVLPFRAVEVIENPNNGGIAAALVMPQVGGKWSVTFSPADSTQSSTAIAEIKQDAIGKNISGTLLSATGDFRYMSGEIKADGSFFMSCFDGAHVFLLKGMIEDDRIKGNFYSGKHWQEPFEGVRDEAAALPDAYHISYVKEAATPLQMNLPDAFTGKITTLNDAPFAGKPVVIQISGTWCPNCMDETALLAQLYPEYADNVEFCAVFFERPDDIEVVRRQLASYQSYFHLQYPVLYGGKAGRKYANEAFPQLNEIASFPTTIFLDKNHQVYKIHSGFSGPATSAYNDLVIDFRQILEEIGNR